MKQARTSESCFINSLLYCVAQPPWFLMDKNIDLKMKQRQRLTVIQR